MYRILDNINLANDIKKINKKDYDLLAKEIRFFLIENVSKTGGHLAANLGVVELTMALHLFLDLPKDKLIWDVGHQSYTHKILTGRKDVFATLRQLDGISGFPKRKESECDSFDTGHSSTAISAALGMAKARDIGGNNNKIVAVLGDGALTGGLAYEALNNAGRMKSNLIIILNDNNMSISENVGGMANYLAKLRTNSKYTGFKENVENRLTRLMPGVGEPIVDVLKRSKDAIKYFMIPSMFFEDMGLTYIGPIDGHNIGQIITALKAASKVNKAVVIHAVTKKGKGYPLAEKYPSRFHGVDPFNINNGKPTKKDEGTSYTKVFSDALVRYGAVDDKIVAITAAMPKGVGLIDFKRHYPKRFFDVGIAEEHAVTFAGGLAASGYKPVVAIYSTFLQRAYDQILHDVCINNLPVVFAIDRAGITGRDGETHQGLFDLSFLTHFPNMTVMAPKNSYELDIMLGYALSYPGPVAIRYPKGMAYEGLEGYQSPIVHGKSELIYKGEQVAILAVGSMVKTAAEVVDILKESGINATMVNVRFVAPFDREIIRELSQNHRLLVTMEENVKSGGYGEKVSAFLCDEFIEGVRQINISVPNVFVEQGGVDELKERLGMDGASIAKRILSAL
ncbi:MAG: 1-deoxy-D-xylulose-5-phosphate synthase [Clostridiales bacterium]|nr:1-deoxy-D-xylulose-5-phosphate synthase [Clostridiales bacterium]